MLAYVYHGILMRRTSKIMTHAGKAGFTLIELSVVLVILGLAIGGVFAGTSLMRSSQVNSIMVDEQKYVAAVNNFKQRYNALPGDMANATTYWNSAAGNSSDNYTTTCYSSTINTNSPVTCNGSGNGQIAGTSTYYPE